MDFVRIELHGNKQTVRIGSLHKAEYDLANTDRSRFYCKTALSEVRLFMIVMTLPAIAESNPTKGL